MRVQMCKPKSNHNSTIVNRELEALTNTKYTHTKKKKLEVILLKYDKNQALELEHQ